METKKNPNPEEIKMRWAALCARSEQCEYDLRVKGVRAGLTRQQTDEIIDFLKKQRFLDDSRYARSLAADKVRFSGWGKNKIKVALAQKRISQSNIDAAISSIDKDDYLDALKRVGNQKAKNLDINVMEERAKFYRQMVARGFESALVTKMIDYLTRRE